VARAASPIHIAQGIRSGRGRSGQRAAADVSALDKGAEAVFNSRKRRQRQVVRFVELVVADALEAPSVAFASRRAQTPASAPVGGRKAVFRADGLVVCERCIVADSPLPRMRGLLGRRNLGSDEGVLLRPAGSIHTFFMRFPIDVVFLDRDGRVLRVAESVRPWRTAAARGARAVLELRAGESGRRRVAVGDVLEVGA
jgi:uncharacterized membrane protein (UPF0127 family)